MSLDLGSLQYLREVLGLEWIQVPEKGYLSAASEAVAAAKSESPPQLLNENNLKPIAQAFLKQSPQKGVLVLSEKTDEVTKALLHRILLSIGMTLPEVVWVEVASPAAVSWGELEELKNLRSLLAFGHFSALREAPHLVFKKNQVTSLVTHDLDLLSHHIEAKRQTWEALKAFQASLNRS